LRVAPRRANARTAPGIIKGSQSLDFDPASAALPPNGRKIRKDFLPCMTAARKFLRISGGDAAFSSNQTHEPQFMRLPRAARTVYKMRAMV
jgi:hypothetical protein